MPQVNVQDAKAQLSRLLAAVEKGEEVVIARNGHPIARLQAVEQGVRELGFLPGRVPDAFFDPLPEEELSAWEPR